MKKAEPTSWEHVLTDLKNFKNEYKLKPVATTTLGCRNIAFLEFLKKKQKDIRLSRCFKSPKPYLSRGLHVASGVTPDATPRQCERKRRNNLQ
jgi:hypothetical protein